MRRSFAIAAVAAALVAGSANAQSTSGSTNGFSIGAQVTGAGLNFSNAAQKVDFGGGWGVQAGYGFGQRFSVIANYDHNSLDQSTGTFDLGQWDALGRFSFLPGSMVRPYIEAGATGRVAKSSSFNGTGGDYTFSGISPTTGIGAQFFISRQVSVNAGLDWTFGNFNNVDNNGNSVNGFNQLDATGTRVRLGATVFPFGH